MSYENYKVGFGGIKVGWTPVPPPLDYGAARPASYAQPFERSYYKRYGKHGTSKGGG